MPSFYSNAQNFGSRLLFGWNMKQWQQAYVYYNTSQPAIAIKPSIAEMIANYTSHPSCDPIAGHNLQKIRRFWLREHDNQHPAA